jgi:3-deoxy-D-manno-octulosonic-acid transferase
LRKYSLLMMQSEEDARRIAAIGAPRKTILVTGNIKFDRSLVEAAVTGKKTGSVESGFLENSGDTPLIVAGSTHPGEEQILLEAFRRVRDVPELARTRLLLAPRHPERFDEVAGLVLRNGFNLLRRTDNTGTANPAEVLLLDTLGELAAAYRFATVAFVGGTLIRRGGHSIMEPALFSRAIVTGPSMENFREIVEEFREHGAIRQIAAGPESRDLQVDLLTQAFADLLRNSPAREAMGKNALSVLERNRGAAGLAADRIASIFEEVRERY